MRYVAGAAVLVAVGLIAWFLGTRLDGLLGVSESAGGKLEQKR